MKRLAPSTLLSLVLFLPLSVAHAQSKSAKGAKDSPATQELKEKLEKSEAAKAQAEAELARLKAVHEPQQNKPPEGVRYFCNRLKAYEQLGNLRDLTLRVREDVSFTAKSINSEFIACRYIISKSRLCVSERMFREASQDPTQIFVIKAGRKVRIPIPEFTAYVSGDDKMSVIDDGGALESLRSIDSKTMREYPAKRLSEASSASEFIKRLEAATGMELLTEIKDRCDPPKGVKKAPAQKRSKDAIQHQLRDQGPSDEIKGNSQESGA